MYRLTWRTPNCADRKALWRLLCVAIITLRLSLLRVSTADQTSKDSRGLANLLDNLNLSVEARCSTLDQRDVGCEAHLVNMPSCIEVVQRIENNREALKPFDVEIWVLDICVMRFQFHIRIEFSSSILRNLGRKAA